MCNTFMICDVGWHDSVRVDPPYRYKNRFDYLNSWDTVSVQAVNLINTADCSPWFPDI